MYIKSLIELEYNDGINGRLSSILSLIIEQVTILEFDKLLINYVYKDIDDRIVKGGTFILDKQQMNDIYDLVENNIISETYSDIVEELYYNGAIIEMARTFDINTNQIEFINE